MGNKTMTILNHTLGFPRVGLKRELKKAQESYWAGNSTQEELLNVGRGACSPLATATTSGC